MRELTPPRGKDAIVALAALAATYVLLIGQGLLLINAGVSRAVAVALLPTAASPPASSCTLQTT